MVRLGVATVTLATWGCGKLKSDDGNVTTTQSALHLTIGPTTGPPRASRRSPLVTLVLEDVSQGAGELRIVVDDDDLIRHK